MKKILKTFKDSKGYIKPHTFLVGPTGSGKTYTINKRCAELDLNLITINAAQLTTEGTSGNSCSRAFRPLVENSTSLNVVFIDEFDKLIVGKGNMAKHEFTSGVQDELLKIVEEGIVHILMDYGKYITVDCKKTLFVLSGAFNGKEIKSIDDLINLGVIKQLVGRVPILKTLNTLSLDYLIGLLKTAPLLINYIKLLEKDLDKVLPDLITSITNVYPNNKIGARLINKVIHRYFIDNYVYTSSKEAIVKDTEFIEE